MMFETPELGHYALILALGLSLAQLLLSIWAVKRKDLTAITLSARAAQIVFGLVSVAMLALIISFLNNDFSVKYVALNSNADLAWYYKISAAWAGHEGSLLLWIWCLSLWTFLVARKTKDVPPPFRAKVLAVLAVVAAGFLSFIIFTSNPFMRLLPTHDLIMPLNGKDLNPMLQDVGLILHPPLLYMGYVGFAVTFSFIVAALIEGRLDGRWARWCRPWAMMAWVFLTLGMALGSWWAYYELGWGGWWFWDPVENASFMPWIAGTALLHAMTVTEKRDAFKVWTAFLAITTFSLSLVGTFLVRSGVLTSVHAFANDPTRGIYILMLLGLISGTAYLLLVLRAHTLQSTGSFEWVSREMGILINNIVLSAGCLIVLVGTLTPLLYDVLGWERISIGAPYFNAKMMWVLIISLVFMTFAPYLHWKRDRVSRLMPILSISAALSLLISWAILRPFVHFNGTAFGLLFLTITSVLVALWDAFEVMRKGRRLPNLAYLTMAIAHLGFLVSCVGIIMASTYSVAQDKYVKVGTTVQVGSLSFKAIRETELKTLQYEGTRIDFLVRDRQGRVLAVLSPEKRNYLVSRMPISESDLIPGLMRDVYVALGEPQGDSAWSVRFQEKPYMRWVWLGALIMAFAGILALFDKRHRAASARSGQAPRPVAKESTT